MSLLSDLDFDGEELEVSIDHRRGGMDKLLSVLVNIGLLDKEPAGEAETVFLHLEFGDQGDPGLRFVAPCPFAENLKVADPLLVPLYLQNIKATFIQPDLSIKIIADRSGFGNDIEDDDGDVFEPVLPQYSIFISGPRPLRQNADRTDEHIPEQEIDRPELGLLAVDRPAVYLEKQAGFLGFAGLPDILKIIKIIVLENGIAGRPYHGPHEFPFSGDDIPGEVDLLRDLLQADKIQGAVFQSPAIISGRPENSVEIEVGCWRGGPLLRPSEGGPEKQ